MHMMQSSWVRAAPARPTAMLLARKGYRVLAVDRATFPSDTISTHVLHPLGVGALGPVGTAGSADGNRMPADPHLCLRLRSVHPRRRAGHGGSARRLLPAADGPRQAAGGRGGGGRRGNSRGLHRREVLIEDGRVVGIKGRSKRGDSVIRARQDRRRRRRPAARSSRRRCGPSSTTRSRRCSRATTATGAGCRWTAGLRTTSATSADLPRFRRTTT